MEQRQPDGSIPRQCTAHSKRSGERCRKPAMRGRTVCRAHGGATPRGVASPHFKHGRWSKDLPVQLVERYEEARQDTERLSLVEEIALVDTRVGILLSALDHAAPVIQNQATWAEIRQLIELRRRLVEAQTEHEASIRRIITIDQAVTLAAALAASVKRHVEDPQVLDAINRDIELLLRSAM